MNYWLPVEREKKGGEQDRGRELKVQTIMYKIIKLQVYIL